MATISEIDTTETHGSTGSTASMAFGRTRRSTSPATTGRKTICRMDSAIDEALTGMYSPASQRASTGVTRGASKVEMEVMVTESATSPRAR